MPPHKPLAEQLASKFVKADIGCWEWTASLSHTRAGPCYPQLSRREAPGVYRMHKAYRVIYEWLVGPIPEGLVLDHLCGNTRCVRPDHLEPVTHRVNILRGDSASARHARQTHCKRGHEFTHGNTYVDTRGARRCRACKALARGGGSNGI